MLQHRMHRIPAKRLNRGLQGLLWVGVIARQENWVVVAEDGKEALVGAVFGVSRSKDERALTRRGNKPRARRPKPALPPVGTSDWGCSMLAKRGGYARQRLCRNQGINPTAQA